MPKAESIGGMVPLPRYVMPDASEPEYDLILEELHHDRRSQIGSSYFYIKSGKNGCVLCKIIHGGGKVYFHEIVDHLQHGISDEDLAYCVRTDTGSFSLPNHYHISMLVEKKLRILYDI